VSALRIALPHEGEGLQVVASVSGGKDSTALILALREAEIPARYVFADTQWEAAATYDYLNTLRVRLGITIDVVGAPGGMLGQIRKRHGFPSRMQRWCTRILKIEPLRKYHDDLGVETISAMGVRGQESAARAKLTEWEDDAEWGGFVWRPLMAWKVEEVLAIHHRHGIPVHPMYREGFDRVGCHPCIYANKDEIRTLADFDPARVDEIAALEDEVNAMRTAANAEKPGRFVDMLATFFQTRDAVGPMPIEKIVSWSRTDRGGRQLPLLQPPPRGGCMRWGMCDVAPEQVDDANPTVSQ
jgi:3'-phosphoadenosine 5'-phosphosulfate sulfotransferase (PAPS reductase)/FAD synthetase